MLARFNVGANNATKGVDRAAIVKEVSSVFSGFTVINAAGYWLGEPEDSVVVEVYAESTETVVGFDAKCRALAKTLAVACDQTAVGLSFVHCSFDLIGKE